MTHFMDVDTGLCDHDAGSIAKDNLELAATQNKWMRGSVGVEG